MFPRLDKFLIKAPPRKYDCSWRGSRPVPPRLSIGDNILAPSPSPTEFRAFSPPRLRKLFPRTFLRRRARAGPSIRSEKIELTPLGLTRFQLMPNIGFQKLFGAPPAGTVRCAFPRYYGPPFHRLNIHYDPYKSVPTSRSQRVASPAEQKGITCRDSISNSIPPEENRRHQSRRDKDPKSSAVLTYEVRRMNVLSGVNNCLIFRDPGKGEAKNPLRSVSPRIAVVARIAEQ